MKNKSDFKLLENNRLFIQPHQIIISVKKKERLTELGTTEYTFSYSFKGDMIDNPIQQSRLIHVAKDMAKSIYKKDGQVLIALDRGGTALGVAVSIVTKLPLYIAFSYFTNPPKDWVHWREKGAGKSLAIPPLPKGTHVILIDDEINTGLTYVDAIEKLKENFIFVDQIVVVAEVLRQKLGRKVIQNKHKEVKISSLHSIPEPIFDKTSEDYIFKLEHIST